MKPQDALAPGKGARETKGDLVGLGAGVAKENAIGAGDQFHQLLGHGDFAFVLRAVVPASPERVLHGGRDRRMTVPQNQRPPGQRVIDVGVAVDIGNPGALAVIEVERMRHRLGAKGAAHAAGKRLLGASEKFSRPSPVGGHGCCVF